MFVDVDVMLSLKGRWWKEIIHNNKVYEVRKNRPVLDIPFKVYVYLTKSTDKIDLCYYSNGSLPVDVYSCGEHVFTIDCAKKAQSNGMVVGEFVVDKITPIKYRELIQAYCIDGEDESPRYDRVLKGTDLYQRQLYDYGKGKTLYGWHVSRVKVYDQPWLLSDFYNSSNQEMKTAPQSWCYCYK